MGSGNTHEYTGCPCGTALLDLVVLLSLNLGSLGISGVEMGYDIVHCGWTNLCM
jgi:hypothetical protein